MSVISIPRPEYPRPQWVRPDWINLNGQWEFEFDHGRSGREKQWPASNGFSRQILVPFCPESELSGINHKDFLSCVWYRRTFVLPQGWDGKRVLIHFGAVDYSCEVWVNGVPVGTHVGGYSSFSFEITDMTRSGENVVTLCAEDDIRRGTQPRGKQSSRLLSHDCEYTRTTGIWQTIWLECVPPAYIESMKLTPDTENRRVHLELSVSAQVSRDWKVRATAAYAGEKMGYTEVHLSQCQTWLTINLAELHVWEPGQGRLYDLSLELMASGETVDRVESYFGLRNITLEGGAILVNGQPVFQRLVLDQGYYPDGIYTAPTDEALRRDIEIAQDMGFNGARLHQKVFEPRFLYWADKLGYLVWGEHASWGLDISTTDGLVGFLPEWLEVLQRDFNHPAIIGWCPFNETWDGGPNHARQKDDVLTVVYQVTKRVDSTRPVIDTSGNFHVVTDVFDVHDYEQDVEAFANHYSEMVEGRKAYVTFPDRQQYEGQPYFVSEYGGIWWNPDDQGNNGWGYGTRPKSPEDFLARYAGLTQALLNNPSICGFCYTQLYDVEQEVNGLYTYERTPKFQPAIIRQINTEIAAIEHK